MIPNYPYDNPWELFEKVCVCETFTLTNGLRCESFLFNGSVRIGDYFQENNDIVLTAFNKHFFFVFILFLKGPFF